LLTVTKLTKEYGKFKALDNVSMELERGSTVLLIGPNGAGKTTLIRCAMGLLTFAGTITLDGHDVFKDDKATKGLVGYVPQYTAFYDNLKVMDQSMLIAKLRKRGREDVRHRLEEVELWDVRTRRVGSLSSGMRQRLGLALALLSDPPMMIFDEPTSNIDLRGQLEFENLLTRLSKDGKTLLITTHLSGLDDFASKAVVLDKGKVIAVGAPGELLRQMNAVDTVYVRLGQETMERGLAIAGMYSKGVQREGDWVLIPVPGSAKAELIKTLLRDCNVLDLLVEPATIESQYLSLLGSAN